MQQHFIDSADLKYQSAQGLEGPLVAAVHALAASIVGCGKILAYGSGISQAHAQMFAALCVAGFARDRPELAAVALSAAAGHSGRPPPACVHYLARQVHALGQAGDVLLLMTVSGNEASLLDAIEAAH